MSLNFIKEHASFSPRKSGRVRFYTLVKSSPSWLLAVKANHQLIISRRSSFSFLNYQRDRYRLARASDSVGTCAQFGDLIIKWPSEKEIKYKLAARRCRFVETF